ncbi:FtsX-like permease family protein, partial [Streptomyces tanashiensis]|uniref:FtsX-like permease family protein n=1 Tax=Streptomyces tanashiensis TaxID=67367 RepID=UPI0033D24CFD
MTVLALGQVRRTPAAFAGLAVAFLLLVATTTLFGSLFASQATAPEAVRATPVAGPGLMVIAGAFGEIAVLVAFFVVVNAIGFALRRQHRELALLRTIAATPRQVRRLVRVQILVTALAVAVPGALAGVQAARLLLVALRERGMAAPGLRVPMTPLPALIALAITLVVGLAASAVAVRRISRIAPAAALTATTTEHGRTGVLRLLVGACALVGCLLLGALVAVTMPVRERPV